MINLEHLTEDERQIIMGVLQKDQAFMQTEEERVKKLKTELHDLRRKSAIKVDEENAAAESEKKACARCREPLGTLFGSGEMCPRCQHKVCTSCKVTLPAADPKKWLCTVCHKTLQIKLESGEVFKSKDGPDMYGTDLVRLSLQKGKTGANDPTVIVEGGPRSPADSGFHGNNRGNNRRNNVSSLGESTEVDTTYEDEYLSDEHSMVESIGPSVSQRGGYTPGAEQAKSRKYGSEYESEITLERISGGGSIQLEAEGRPGLSDEERSNTRTSLPSAIPTIAIHDAVDTASEKGSRTASSTLLSQAKEAEKYRGSTSSLASLYSTGEEFYGKYPITGDVNFGLGYNFKTNVFQVKIGGCRDLVPIDAKRNKSDPYIKTYLLPDKSKHSKRKTKTKKGTINPNFSENLKYDIAQSELETRTLSVAVWHHERVGHNMFLGEVLLPLDSVQVNNYPVKWHQLMTRVPPTETKPISYKGDIIIALMFETHKDENAEANGNEPSKSSKRKKKKAKQIGGTLKVHVKEAKNLMSPRVSGAVNPYVKLYLEPDRSKAGKKKTSVMKNTVNPNYEQTLEFNNLTEEMLKERALEVGIWDSEPMGHALLGGVRLGPGHGKSYGRSADWQDSTGIEIQLWGEMLRNHNQWVEASLTLRASFHKEK